MCSDASSSLIRFNIGGKKFCTTIDTLTQREPDSMLAAMFSGHHTVCTDSPKGYVFVDRDGKHLRHILNWLRDAVVPTLSDSRYSELCGRQNIFRLLGLIDEIMAVLNKRKEDEELNTELTRTDIIKCIESEKVRFRGVNLSGLDLSKLDVDVVGSIFHNATLRECEFTGANLHGALLAGASLKVQTYKTADLTNANLEGANLEGANLKGAKLYNANLKGANLQRAYLRHVNLHNTHLEGAKLDGAIR